MDYLAYVGSLEGLCQNGEVLGTLSGPLLPIEIMPETCCVKRFSQSQQRCFEINCEWYGQKQRQFCVPAEFLINFQICNHTKVKLPEKCVQ